MSAINDGRSAFPQAGFLNQNNEVVTAGCYFAEASGMTLRDWFAGQASDDDVAYWLRAIGANASREQAKYAHADAMLKARGVQTESEFKAGKYGWIMMEVYHGTPEHEELLRARFPKDRLSANQNTFEFMGHRWRYKCDSFDQIGEFSIIERPNKEGGNND